jgi:hypothetical protein
VTTVLFSAGDYRFLPAFDAARPYCNGVVAEPRYEIVRATLERPIPYQEGFQFIERHLASLNRPRQALCGLELRCGQRYTPDGFGAFNAEYRQRLREWGLFAEGLAVTTRTNVAPEVDAPSEQVLYAFSYTVPSLRTVPTFVTSGVIEARSVQSNDNSLPSLRMKTASIVATLDEQLQGLGLGWEFASAVGVYTVHDVWPALRSEVMPPLKARAVHGVRWFPSNPPVTAAMELGVWGVRQELLLSVD